MNRLDGKVILITGSATGIGEGIARRVAAEGATPVIHGREEERSTGGSIAEELGGVFIPGELSEPDQPPKIIQTSIDLLGRLDGLVNNAGVSWRGGLECSVEFFDKVIAINARAPFLMIQAAQPHLKAGRGSIVNIGSSLARQGAAGLLPYSMSKAALANLTKSLSSPFAQEGIRINCLNLGWTLTPNERLLHVKHNDEEEDWMKSSGRNLPFGRHLLPEDIAIMVAYLLSSEAQMITGQVWDFDQRSFAG